MDLRLLRYFLEISREGNITRAADKLHITQPTLSRQISALEESLGKKLYVRTNYGIRLTEEGLLLRKRAEEMT
ncbi:MAG: LysR family transcriptional regulator, partial [Synergistaceae bacterium]|nr:LysR family transcriptional regulator [Synergistaceae bacterium]